eukprot:m.39090 g.39090  ORF g.39090 m.39090 type:complete len:956 (+) comp32671_c0_seq4:18-2885(+)
MADFSIEDVLELGGEKEDYDFLKDLDEDCIVETGMGAPLQASERNEIKNFVGKLGLAKVVQSHAFMDDSEEEEIGERGKGKDRFGKEKKSKLNGVEKKSSSEDSQKDNKTESKKAKTKKAKKRGTNEKDPAVIVGLEQLNDLKESGEKLAKRLLVTPGGSWFTKVSDLTDGNDEKSVSFDSSLLDVCLSVGAKLLSRDADLFKKRKEAEKSGDSHWLKTVLTSGTLSDRLAAITLQIQESPVHQLNNLDTLVHMTKKKGKRESLLALDTIKQLWMADLLPEDRRLVSLSQRPLNRLFDVAKSSGRDARDRLLLLWYFEDQLHKRCEEIVQALQTLVHDVLDDVRKKAQGTAYDLLASKPEQEEAFLSLLVNKLGDPERKVASRSSFLLLKLVNIHPNMKPIIVREVEKVLYRPNISPKAQYFAVCFLNQLILSKKEIQLANRLVDIYFSFFKAYTKKGAMDAKMLGALLCGVNRAFPFAKIEDDSVFQDHVDMLFKLVHTGTFHTSVQALMLLYQVMESRESMSDRFFQAIYSKLFDPQLLKASKLSMFFNVLYKSMKVDPSVQRIKAFLKRQLQVCLQSDPSFICSMLYLISEIGKSKPGLLKTALTQAENGDEKAVDDDQKQGVYNPLGRNPLYCGAEFTLLWEVQKLAFHFHPSVSHFANLLLQGSEIKYKGDTFQDFALTHFLDRFVYKNPKQKKQDHGGSVMQPIITSSRLQERPVNMKTFVSQSEDRVREDELFFYRYFKRKFHEDDVENKKKDKKKKKQEREGQDMEDDADSDVSEESVDFAGALKSSKKKDKKRAKADDESISSDDFNYNDLEDDMSDDELAGSKDQFNEQDYEKALLENLSSEDDEKEEDASRKKPASAFDMGSMFAAADDFAHLLEDTPAGLTGTGQDFAPKSSKQSLKEVEWERKRAELTTPYRKKWRKERPPRKRGKSEQLQKHSQKKRKRVR